MSNSENRQYITTTLPYVNSDPHIGFAMEIIRADIVARWNVLQGKETFFNTGTDEHGQKLFDDAKKAGKDVKEYVDGYAERFRDLKGVLGLSDDIHFIRTTDSKHEAAAQEFWKRCDSNGYIYKKNYQIKYCVGCELEKTDSELVDGKCPLHPNRDIELIDEENYFFKFSEFQDKLLKFYSENPTFVIPDFRYNEIKAFVSRGLEDFSISRLKEKMSWGVSVPGDDKHVMYVWFDALVSYVSTLGWPTDEQNFDDFWKNGNPIQYCGKDNLRQQSAMWQAMLMAAGLPNSNHIIINGFIQSGGQKMSKSLGNVISPVDVVNMFGTDALRYFVARDFSNFEDFDVTMEKLKESYNANLANGIGNLTSRIMKMAENNLSAPVTIEGQSIPQSYIEAIESFEIQKAGNIVWEWIAKLDRKIQESEPFKLVKTDPEQGKKIIAELVTDLYTIGRMLNPILPETSTKIKALVKENKSPETPLFSRRD